MKILLISLKHSFKMVIGISYMIRQRIAVTPRCLGNAKAMADAAVFGHVRILVRGCSSHPQPREDFPAMARVHYNTIEAAFSMVLFYHEPEAKKERPRGRCILSKKTGAKKVVHPL